MATAATADTFVVTTRADAVDVQPGNGTCAAAGGACTLRAAIQESDQHGGTDMVVLPGGRYRLTVDGAAEAGGDLDVSGRVVIRGAGARRTIVDAMGDDRALRIREGANAVVARLTLTRGHALEGGGAFIEERGRLALARTHVVANTADDLGGGVFNQGGTFVARDSAFVGNLASDDGGGIAADSPSGTRRNITSLMRVSVVSNVAAMDGGGVEVEEGDLTLVESTVSGNRTIGQDGGGQDGGGQDGGGIEIDRGNNQASMTAIDSAIFDNAAGDNGGGIENDTAEVELVNTTVSRNTAATFGGGVDQTVGPSVLRATSSTIHGNVAQKGGGGVSNRTGNSLVVSNSVIAANEPQDCGGAPPADGGVVPVTSGGSNLASDGTCTLTQSSDLPASDPRLGPLALNGGRTRTHALLADSPAIDAATGGPSADQRGVVRPQGLAPDMGAFEFVPHQHLLVPAYFYPGGGGIAWMKMCNLIHDSRASAVIVMNPSNGVFRHAHPAYTAAMNYCQSKGLAIIGYVFTTHGERPPLTVKHSIDHYYSDYPGIRGIFFDEMSNDPGTYAYYEMLYQYVKGKSTASRTHVVGNPGSTASTDWQLRECLVPVFCPRLRAPVVDILVNFEGPYLKRLRPDPAADPDFVTAFKDWTPPAWVSNYPSSKFAHLVYRSTTATTTRSACAASAQKRGGSLFVTTDDPVPSDPLWNLAPDTAMLACPTLQRNP